MGLRLYNGQEMKNTPAVIYHTILKRVPILRGSEIYAEHFSHSLSMEFCSLSQHHVYIDEHYQ